MGLPTGGQPAAGGAGGSAAECAEVRPAAKLNCHLLRPVPVGARWGPDLSCHLRRAVLPSSAAEIREFLVFVHSGVCCPPAANKGFTQIYHRDLTTPFGNISYEIGEKFRFISVYG